MKKVLIISTSTGEGHNQAANSISNLLEKCGYIVFRNDFLKNNSKILSRLFIGGYEFLASLLPNIYGLFYKLTDKRFTNIFLSIIFSLTRKKLSKLIKETNPDIILVTHPFAVSIIASLKKKGLEIPTVAVVTDFKAHSTYIDKSIDIYIVGSEYTKLDLSARGVSKEKIYPLGIPVKDEFFNKNPNIYSAKDNEYFNILLMSGSMGLKNISHVLKELLTNSHKLRITVVCGNNSNLKKSLLEKYNHSIKNKKLHILGFSTDVDSLMDYSDLIISKPGGLTSTEAIVKNLPLLIPFAIPGQETQNTDFLTSNGYALYVENLLELNLIVDKLIDNPTELKKIQDRMHTLSSTYSKTKLIQIFNDIEKK